MYTHRGAYLNALGELIHSRHSPESVYLWTLPMFHCNGWCTTWAVTALGGTHVALRAVDPDEIWRLIQAEGRHPPQRGADRADLAGQLARRRSRSTGHSWSPPPVRRPARPSSPHMTGLGRPTGPRVRADRDLRAPHRVRGADRHGPTRRPSSRPSCRPARACRSSSPIRPGSSTRR